MNYKSLIRSRELRLKILSALSWVPDRIMIPLQYRIHTGRKLNMNHPKRFTEKIQLYKLRYRNPLMLRCTDKYEVRKVVEEMGLKDILIPLVGVYDNVEEINFENLPSQFVAKTTDGGGGNQVLICRDKEQLGKDAFFNTLKGWMSMPKTKNAGREWAYENGCPRRIIIEKLLVSDGHKDLPDYKFFCFGGEVGFVYGIDGRNFGNGARLGIYTPDFEKMEVYRADEIVQAKPMCKPENYESMVSLARRLSEEFPHVRVDLYNVDGRVYFGELTFYDGSGYMGYSPDSFDFEAGALFSYF